MMGQSEINVLIDNRVLSKITQGITTEVTGEGGSVAPLTDRLVLADSDAMKKWHYREDWRGPKGYFPPVQRQGSPPHNPLFVRGAPGGAPPFWQKKTAPPPPARPAPTTPLPAPLGQQSPR